MEKDYLNDEDNDDDSEQKHFDGIVKSFKAYRYLPSPYEIFFKASKF